MDRGQCDWIESDQHSRDEDAELLKKKKELRVAGCDQLTEWRESGDFGGGSWEWSEERSVVHVGVGVSWVICW